MTFNGWAALLNGVLLSGSCDDSQETFNELCPSEIPLDDEDGQLATFIDALVAPPEGLGVPPLRTEDLTFVQRDGVKHYNDWYEPRVITLQASVCPDDCPSCGGVGTTGLTARQKVALITEAWSRQCCDVELVLFTDCNGTLDPSTQYPEEEGTTTRTNLALNPAAVEDGSDAEWIERYPLKGTYTRETADGPSLELSSWIRKEFTDTQTANDDGMDHYQSVDAAPPLGVVETLDWTEAWADTTAWTGTGWVAGGGEVESTTPGATIYRDTSDVVGKVELTDTFNTTVQLLDADAVVLATVVFPVDPSVGVAADVTVSAVTDDTAVGDGAGTTTLQLDYVAGTLEVSGTTPAPWSATVDFAGTPTRIQLVGPDGATSNGDFTAGVGQQGDYVAVGPSGDVYVLDTSAGEILKFDSDGTPITSWVQGLGVAAPIAVDAAENVYLAHTTGTQGRVYKYTSVGVFVAFYPFTKLSSTGTMTGIDIDSAGNIYVAERGTTIATSVVHKLDSGGVSVGLLPVSGDYPRGLAIDSADNLYLAEDASVEKYTADAPVLEWVADNAADVAADNSGFVYVAETGAIRKYSSTGTLQWEIATPVDMQALDVSDDGVLIYGVGYDNTVYRWVQAVGHTDEMEAYVLNFPAIARQLEPSTQYTISGYGYAESATTALFRIVARLHDGAGNWLATETAGTSVETDDVWARAEVTFTTPALPASGVIYLAARHEWVKTDWQIGDVLGGTGLQIETAAAASTYFDGDTTWVSQTDGQLQYVWSGVANASESVESFHDWAYLTNRDINGPYGVVGRPRGCDVSWHGPSKCAELSLRFESANQNLYVLDDCGTPGYEECVDITPGVPEYVMCAPFCDPWCATTPVDGTGPLPVTFTVTGTQRVYPEITLWPDLTGTITVENITDGTTLTYSADVQGEPVVINTQDGTAFQGDTNVTYLLGGNVTTFSLLPGPYEFRVLLPEGADESAGTVTVCWRPSVISA